MDKVPEENKEVAFEAPQFKAAFACGTQGGGTSFNLMCGVEDIPALWKDVVTRGIKVSKISPFPVTNADLKELKKEVKGRDIFYKIMFEYKDSQLSTFFSCSAKELEEKLGNIEATALSFIKAIDAR